MGDSTGSVCSEVRGASIDICHAPAIAAVLLPLHTVTVPRQQKPANELPMFDLTCLRNPVAACMSSGLESGSHLRTRRLAMLTVLGRTRRMCDGLTRRQLLQVGGAGLLGVDLPKVLAAEARATLHGGRAKSVIFVFLFGGPSQLETF